jgi:hypothetical protein
MDKYLNEIVDMKDIRTTQTQTKQIGTVKENVLDTFQ